MLLRVTFLVFVAAVVGLLVLPSDLREGDGAHDDAAGRAAVPEAAESLVAPEAARSPGQARGIPLLTGNVPESGGVPSGGAPPPPGRSAASHALSDLARDLAGSDPARRRLAIEALSEMGGGGARMLLARGAADPAVTETDREDLKRALRQTRGRHHRPYAVPASPDPPAEEMSR